MGLPIKKIVEIEPEDIGSWFRKEDIVLCQGFGPYLRIYWEKKPTKDEMMKLRRLI